MKKYVFIVLVHLCVYVNAGVNSIVLPNIPNNTFSILNYGASVGSTNNTAFIQAAIDACGNAGGGTVIVPAGVFLCGPLNLKGNVNLHLNSGSVLKMLPYGEGNGTPVGSYPNNGTVDNYIPLINGNKVNNIKVSGSGTIDGQGLDWWLKYRSCKCIGRPGVIRFDNCNYVQIDSITIVNAPNVHITVGKTCTNSTISNVVINSPSDSPNTDGIDIWSPYVDVLNCSIACGDDNIAMDSNSRYITIKNCKFGTGHGCSIGSYASNVGNILVDSCEFNGTSNGARFKTSRDRGGVEEYITYSNCVMNNVSNPFYLSSYYPKEPLIPDTASSAPVTANTPTWRHITFKNIVVNNSTYAGIIWGLPELSITDVVFDNVQINASTIMKAYNVKDLVFKNNSCINIPTLAKKNGKVIDLYNANMSGLDVFTGQALAETKQYINLAITDEIASRLKASYDGTSTSVELKLPSNYENPNGTSVLDLTQISTVIKNLTISGNETLPKLKTLQINLSSNSGLNTFTLKKLTILGVEDGSAVGTGYLFYPNTAGITVGSFTLDSCRIKNYYGVIRVANIGSAGNIPSINVNNCIVSNLGGYGFATLGNSSYYYSGDINVRNSTFYNIQASLFYARYTTNVKVTLSDCTFDNILSAPTSYFFYGNTTSSLNVENCILGKTINSSSGGITSNTTNIGNSYKTLEWVNGTNTTSQFSLYNYSVNTLCKIPSVYDAVNLTNSTNADYTIIDSFYPGRFTTGDPRWYYRITAHKTESQQTKYYTIKSDAVEFSTATDYELFTITGRKIGSSVSSNRINLNNLPKGIYVLRINNQYISTVISLIR